MCLKTQLPVQNQWISGPVGQWTSGPVGQVTSGPEDQRASGLTHSKVAPELTSIFCGRTLADLKRQRKVRSRYLFLTLAVVGTLVGLEEARLALVLGHLNQGHGRLHRGVAGVNEHHHLGRREDSEQDKTRVAQFMLLKRRSFHCKCSLFSGDALLCNVCV